MRYIVFGTGRCNPPTSGHFELIKRIKGLAEELNLPAEFHIVDGEQSSKDLVKNPLTPEQRIAFLRSYFPTVRFEISQSAYDSMEVLEVQNKAPAFMVAGSDRAKKYRRLLDYSGFSSAQIIEVDRTRGVAQGVSATAARAAAKAGDYEEFSRMMPSDFDQTREVFNLVRKALLEDGSR